MDGYELLHNKLLHNKETIWGVLRIQERSAPSFAVKTRLYSLRGSFRPPKTLTSPTRTPPGRAPIRAASAANSSSSEERPLVPADAAAGTGAGAGAGAGAEASAQLWGSSGVRRL